MLSHSVDIPIRVQSSGSVPLYLQIKYQVTYLISSGHLPEQAKLPPVRALAADLNINPNTVAQAYKELQSEGLIVSYQGRGSFVRPFSPGTEQTNRRLRQLSEILRRAREQARALGFADAEIVRHLSSLAQQEPLPYTMAFVATTGHVAEKYAQLVQGHLGSHIRATPLSLDALTTATGAAATDDIHVFLTFARLVPSLEEVLDRRSQEHHIIGIATEVTPATIAQLAELDPGRRHLLLTEERFLHSSLNLIQDHSPLSPDDIESSIETRADHLHTNLDDDDVILFTFSRRALAEELCKQRRCLELMFDISRDSVVKLRGYFPTFGSEGPATGGPNASA